jgi:integrase/recombinase XerD
MAPTQEVAMLAEVYPRYHARFASLPLLGQYIEGFLVWLHSHGCPLGQIRRRIHETTHLDARLRRQGIRQLEDLSAADFLRFAPRDSQDDMYMSALVRSLTRYLDAQGVLRRPAATQLEQVIVAYRAYLERVRGLAEQTLKQHGATAMEFLTFIGFDGDPGVLRALGSSSIEAFLRGSAKRLGRSSLKHMTSYLRSFLRFLASRGQVARGLDSWIDTPRLYRGERLPRALPWETVRAFLAAIDRSTPMGKRDYAIFLLIASYGLRAGDVAALQLDDLEWRAGRIRVSISKTKTQLVLPLTKEIGAALFDYLRHARPHLPCRKIFLRVRAPAGPLARTGITEAFQGWTRRGGLPIPYQGPHCLRHSLAVHLLRQGTPLKTIGDILGHRSLESTCVYLRLHVEDLRDVALDLPQERRP